MNSKTVKWTPLSLRLILGIGFLSHGGAKVADGTQVFQGLLQMIGVPGGAATAWFVASLEVVGGLALLAGAFTTLITPLLIADMLVALFTVHLPHGFSFLNITGMGPEGPQFGLPGYEVPLLYIAGLTALFLGGAGAVSVDGMRRAACSVGRHRPAAESRLAAVQPTH
jgi:putative oxidoreductase